MSNTVIPRQQGDDYQAKYFWFKACNLFFQNSTATRIAWEHNNAPGFDDISVYYEPAILDKTTGGEITGKFYQVKFHVDHNKGFTCDALMDSEFIGNKTESILQRLQKNFKKDKEVFEKSLYYIVNTWGIDHSDELRKLVNNSGAINLKKLFDNTGDTSAMGKIRSKWKKHLKITDNEELRTLLSGLRIRHSSHGPEELMEQLNFRFLALGVQPFSETQRATSLTNLIQQLHAEERNVFTKDELIDILKREKLIIKQKEQEKVYKIGVRSFKKGTDVITAETDEYLCLLEHFTERFASDDQLWQSAILPSLVKFSEGVVAKNLPLLIHLDTHHSIAFALGYHMDIKSGVKTSVVQKTAKGRIIFEPDHTSEDYLQNETNLNWQFQEVKVDENANDIVLSLSVTHDISNDVLEFASDNIPGISRIVSASILSKPSPVSIRNGNHIALAVQELISKIREGRSASEKKGTLHLFIAAPNAFLFSLGQQIKSLGKIKLYEFDFESTRTGTYNISIQLPI